nr:MAG TPA: putative outer membrane protein [Caudoviricetes sp.]
MKKQTTLKLAAMGIALFGTAVVTESVFADVTKAEGSTELVATDPQVTVTKKEEDSIWSDVEVNIKTDIPDEVPINEGDKMTFNIPEELNLETSYNFPVYNETGETEVGTADVQANERTVTTTFNNYFQENPLDKNISLNFTTKINREIVQENTKRNISFNGTVVEINAGSKGTINPNEELYKYGYQDRGDQNLIHWVARLNYKRQTMEDVNIADTWSDDQDYVEGSLIYSYVKDVDPWVYDSPATQAQANTKFNANGFITHIDKIENKILMVEYKTRLRTPVVYNPTNLFTASWKGGFVSHEAETKLYDGNGKASGKSRPKFDKPNDAPKYELPEFEGGVVPLDPPVHVKPEWNGGTIPNDAPVHDKPEWKGSTVPFDAPKYELPEWDGGVIPNDAPILDKPEIDLADIPLMPPAPVLEKPEFVIPEVPTTKEDKLKVEGEIKEYPAKTAKQQPLSQPTLPDTGTNETSYLAIGGIVVGVLGLGMAGMKKKKGDK